MSDSVARTVCMERNYEGYGAMGDGGVRKLLVHKVDLVVAARTEITLDQVLAWVEDWIDEG